MANLSKLPSYVQLPKKNIKTGWDNAQPYGKSALIIPIRSQSDFGFRNLYSSRNGTFYQFVFEDSG